MRLRRHLHTWLCFSAGGGCEHASLLSLAGRLQLSTALSLELSHSISIHRIGDCLHISSDSRSSFESFHPLLTRISSYSTSLASENHTPEMSGAQRRSGEDVTPTPQEAALSSLPTEIVSDTEQNKMLHTEQNPQKGYERNVVDPRICVINCLI